MSTFLCCACLCACLVSAASQGVYRAHALCMRLKHRADPRDKDPLGDTGLFHIVVYKSNRQETSVFDGGRCTATAGENVQLLLDLLYCSLLQHANPRYTVGRKVIVCTKVDHSQCPLPRARTVNMNMRENSNSGLNFSAGSVLVRKTGGKRFGHRMRLSLMQRHVCKGRADCRTGVPLH